MRLDAAAYRAAWSLETSSRVFRTEFLAPIARFKDIPAQPAQPPLADADKVLVMRVELPILGGHVRMGTDAAESMGFTATPGNNVYRNLEPDTRA